MKTFSYIFSSLVCFSASAKNDPNISEEIHKLLQGRFDNNIQYILSKNEEEPFSRLHSYMADVEIQGFNRYTIISHQYSNNQINKPYRQRIYSFVQESESKVRLDFYKLIHPEKYYNVVNEPELVKNITVDELSFIEGCSVYLEKKEDTWVGKTKKGSCQIEVRGTKMTVESHITLNEKKLTIFDQSFGEDGELLWGRKDNKAEELHRARQFSCWLTQKNSDENADTKWKLERNAFLHDQGAELHLEGFNNEEYTLKLSQLLYGQKNLPILKVGLHRKGESKTISYSWADTNAKLLGINLGWLQGSCKIKP